MRFFLLRFSVAAVLFTVSAISSCYAADQAKLAISEASVRQIISEISAAYLKNDAEKLGSFMSADCITINTLGTIRTKDEFVKQAFDGLTERRSHEAQNLKVRVYGQTAVATYNVYTKFKRRGIEADARFATTQVFAVIDGQTRIVSSHTVAADEPVPRSAK